MTYKVRFIYVILIKLVGEITKRSCRHPELRMVSRRYIYMEGDREWEHRANTSSYRANTDPRDVVSALRTLLQRLGR
jgi:hypothetical protein